MISFTFTEQDRAILDEARRQAKLAAKYARDFESDEDKLLPAQYPEAEGLPNVHGMLDCCTDEISGHKIINALIYLEDWYGGVPLREARYSLGNTVLKIAGTPQQYTRWRDKTIAIGLTEPLGGSDPASTRTSARYDPKTDEWVVNGDKIFITYAQGCDAVLLLARMLHPDRPQQLSTFLIEKRFNHIDGDLKKTLQSFSESRPVVAAYALGVSRAALDFTWKRLHEIGVEPDYNTPLTRQPAAADRLSRLEAEWEATWLSVVRAKWIEQREGPGKIDSSVAKAMGGQLARRVTQTCVDVLGACGLSAEHLPEKWFRDARIFDIYEGTGEIQRLIIARDLLGYTPKELN